MIDQIARFAQPHMRPVRAEMHADRRQWLVETRNAEIGDGGGMVEVIRIRLKPDRFDSGFQQDRRVLARDRRAGNERTTIEAAFGFEQAPGAIVKKALPFLDQQDIGIGGANDVDL